MKECDIFRMEGEIKTYSDPFYIFSGGQLVKIDPNAPTIYSPAVVVTVFIPTWI